MPIAVPLIIAGGTIAGATIAAVGVNQAAETAKQANEDAIASQERAQAEQKAAAEKAALEKETALSEFKLPGVLETPEGAKLKTTLEQRMAGVGVGYSPEVLKADTAATAAQTRAGLKEQTIPSINAAASARGLGRSTIPVSQIGSATQAAERDIESRVAQLQVASEAQKSTDIQNALSQYGSLASEQTRAKQLEAEAIRTGKFDIADTNISAANSRLASSSTISELIMKEGTTSAAYQLQQAAILAGAIQGAGTAISNGIANDEIIKAINNIQNKNSARVDIAGAGGVGTQEVLAAPANQYRLLPVS